MEFPPTPEPHTIEFELTNKCNARCVFCPHSKMTRPKGLMDLRQFCKALDDIDRHRSSWWLNQAAGRNVFPRIVFAGLGEPLLHPQTEAFIAACSEKGYSTRLVTNGLLLSREKVVALASAGLSDLAISLHTLDPVSYQDLVGLPLSRVLPAIEASLDALSSTSTEVELWRVLPPPDMTTPTDDEMRFAELLKKYPRVRMLGPSQPWERDGTVLNSLHGPVNDYPEAGIPCALAYFTSTITWEGDVTLCCVDLHRRTIPLGNLFADGILSVMERRTSNCRSDRPEICRFCRKWRDRQYDEAYDNFIAIK
jgi:pyruvate-formate lyase-activating enzyme